uniref:Uncharacterized protein n=1 Tax=Timema tahoe TaxID=61484 RepID=A0A7R9IAI0_9NEOP|nr:unnamed protein product [Timema tahoe]
MTALFRVSKRQLCTRDRGVTCIAIGASDQPMNIFSQFLYADYRTTSLHTANRRPSPQWTESLDYSLSMRGRQPIRHHLLIQPGRTNFYKGKCKERGELTGFHYGRVQSVKLLPRREEEGSTGLCATVAFMDIKSAAKAHNMEHKLDERCLSTEYYEPAAIPGGSAASLYVGPRFPHGLFYVAVGLELGQLSFMRTDEERLEWKRSGSGLKN